MKCYPHASFTDVLGHLSVGGGLAVVGISAAAAVVAWVIFR